MAIYVKLNSLYVNFQLLVLKYCERYVLNTSVLFL